MTIFYHKKTISYFLTAAVLLLTLAAFSSCESSKTNLITWSDDSATSAAEGAAADGTTVTISRSGSYTLAGSCPEGRLVIDSPELGDIFLYFDDLSLACSTASVIQIIRGENVYFIINDGAVADINDKRPQGRYDDDAAIFGRCDMIFQGLGTLTVNSANEGIHSSDDLKVKTGIINITAGTHGIKGRDSVKIDGGIITIDAGRDGIKSTFPDKSTKGIVKIDGGEINIKCMDDGIQSSNEIRLRGGKIIIDTANNGFKSEYRIEAVTGVIIEITTADKGFNSPSILGDGTAVVTVNGESIAIN
ncbi:MAG: carbohydrate-binding domain-containing protein [Clostridiales bacterium]|nr:carbohydrate-binding domain-containing protein [Clostridiales bacterium]